MDRLIWTKLEEMELELVIFHQIILRKNTIVFKKKHIQILDFYDFEYELEELETTWFNSLSTLKRFLHIDSDIIFTNQ